MYVGVLVNVGVTVGVLVSVGVTVGVAVEVLLGVTLATIVSTKAHLDCLFDSTFSINIAA